jgi:hypothetical protein
MLELAEVFTTAERTRERKRASQRTPALNMTVQACRDGKEHCMEGTKK